MSELVLGSALASAAFALATPVSLSVVLRGTNPDDRPAILRALASVMKAKQERWWHWRS